MLGLFLARYRSALVRIQGNVVVKTSREDAEASAARLRGALPGERARLIPADPVEVSVRCSCPIHDASCKHAVGGVL